MEHSHGYKRDAYLKCKGGKSQNTETFIYEYSTLILPSKRLFTGNALNGAASGEKLPDLISMSI